MPAALATDGLSDARRIAFLGCTGSGKSTAAHRLSETSGIPWVSADDLNWRPGWQPAPRDEQARTAAQVCAGDAWIIDTVYSAWADAAAPRIQLYVALDLPRLVSLASLVGRTVRRIRAREEVCHGNRETWRKAFASRDSILVWHVRSFSRKRRHMRAMEAAVEGTPVLRFTRRKDVEAWIASISHARQEPS